MNRLYGPGVDEPLVEWVPNTGRTRFLHHDALGSITCVSDRNGTPVYTRTYRAFGKMTETLDTSNFPNSRLGYTSREISTGSLMQYRSRWYDSGVGRFAQQDSYRGEGIHPSSLHRYAPMLNNPVRYIDPNGRTVQDLENVMRYMTWRHPLMSAVLAVVTFVDFPLGALTLPGNPTPGWYWMPYPFAFGFLFLPREMLESHPGEDNVLGFWSNILYHELLHIVFAWYLGLIGYLILNSYKQWLHEAIHRMGDEFGAEYQQWLRRNNFDHSSLPSSINGVFFIDF